MSTATEFEAALTTAVDKHLASGGKIKHGLFRFKDECCPIGAALPMMTDRAYAAMVELFKSEYTLEVSVDNITSFVRGFDGWAMMDDDSDFHTAGVNMRAKYEPLTPTQEEKPPPKEAAA